METLPCLLMKKVMPWAELKTPGVNGNRHIFYSGLYFHWLGSDEHMVIVKQIGDGSCRSKFIPLF